MPSLRRLASLGLALAVACTKPPAGKEAAPTDAATAAATGGPAHDASEGSPAAATDEKAAPADGCTDWSTLDPASLPPLPASPYTDTFEAVWNVVREKHFDPTLGCLDWPALRLEYGRKVAAAKNPAEAYGAIREMLGKLGQSHFALIADDEGRARGDGHLPFSLRWIEGAAVVTRSPDFDGPATVTGTLPGGRPHVAPRREDPGAVPPGSEVIAIDGQDVASAVKAAEARDGVGTEAFRIRRALDELASCVPGTPVEVVVRPPLEETTRTYRVRCVAEAGETVSLGHLRNVPTRVEHRMVPGTKIGVVAFNVWMLPMVPRIEAAVAELRRRGARAMILDLRGNPGGVGAMSVPVARLFLRDGGSLGKLRFRTFEQAFNVMPNPDAFDGPLAILVDEGTGSTSEIFAMGMQALGRAIVVGGGPSAGAALPSLIESLPGGARLQFVVGAYEAPGGGEAEGQGVRPDVPVTERASAFARGEDPVLDAAVRVLQERLAEGTTASPTGDGRGTMAPAN
ncbi:MAG: hypothetical protein D6705_07405 [Deltaproteobacteria bacterium]|nr:MAG: hypothetical protein D6705_07405 [Deltaproteobacteria bacterium]